MFVYGGGRLIRARETGVKDHSQGQLIKQEFQIKEKTEKIVAYMYVWELIFSLLLHKVGTHN